MNRQEQVSGYRDQISAMLILLTLAACFALVAHWERSLTAAPPATPAGTWRLRDYASAAPAATPSLFNRSEKQGTVTVRYRFVAPGDRPMRFTFSLPLTDYAAYRNRFGYRQDELDALFREQQQRLEQAYNNAVASGQPQTELDAIYATIKADFHARTARLIFDRGFRFVNDTTLTADIPRIVRDSVPHLRPAALALIRAARQQGVEANDIVAIALPFAQTALAYETLPPQRDGRLTAGFSPPLEVLLEGRGDCDSKTALLAAMLLNWDKMQLIGIGVPGHYLLGVLRHPGRGDAFYEHDGRTYVLMEPAGPAWLPPGMVAESTLRRIGSGEQIIVEPLSAI